MDYILFDLTLKDILLSDCAHSSDIYKSRTMISFQALHRYSGSAGRQFVAGGRLEVLVGEFRIHQQGKSNASLDESIGTLTYFPQGENVGGEGEAYEVDLTLTDDKFSMLEHWIRQGISTVQANLTTEFFRRDGIKFPDISDEISDNTSILRLSVLQGNLTLKPVVSGNLVK
jgi:hypothetical protein